VKRFPLPKRSRRLNRLAGKPTCKHSRANGKCQNGDQTRRILSRDGRTAFRQRFAGEHEPGEFTPVADGLEQPINVLTDNGFGGIEFYGTGTNTTETETRVYYLVTSDGAGLRVLNTMKRGLWRALLRLKQPSNAVTVRSILRFAQRRSGKFLRRGGHQYGRDQNLTVNGLADTGKTARLEINLQGVTHNAHSVRVEINGTTVVTANFNELEQGSAVVNVPITQLHEGENSCGLSPMRRAMSVW